MYLIVKNTLSLQGKITPPGSKSQSIRSILFSVLANGESSIINLLDSEDTQTALRVCEIVGASVSLTKNRSIIKSRGLPLETRASEITTGNSGITTLFVLPILGLREDCTIPILFNCGDQMRTRPIQSLINALCHLGMVIKYVHKNNQLPVLVSGKLKGGVVEVDGMNSQYLSALLISLPCVENNSVITVRNLHERPYIDMTLDFLKKQKIEYTHNRLDNSDIFDIKGNQRYAPLVYRIKNDFSSAAFLIAAAVLISNKIELLELDLDHQDFQADKKLITILQEMGAEIIIEKNKLYFKNKKILTGMRIDARDIPDLVPVLAVIATQAMGKTEVYNVKQARLKETDRIFSITEGLRKMGAHIEEREDGMTIYQGDLKGDFVNGYGDHRTVMALTVAGMVARGITVISDGESINKTYPKFVKDIQSIGANVRFSQLEFHHHIILIGFKHVGKTEVGQRLARKLTKNFIDLDQEIEKTYQKNCREIMQSEGEVYYRAVESEALKKILQSQPCVISLGGGTVLSLYNQKIIKPHLLFHLVAPRDTVFQRIMAEGSPAFFDSKEDSYQIFNRLWDEREIIYKKIRTVVINNNNRTAEQTADKIITYIADLL